MVQMCAESSTQSITHPLKKQSDRDESAVARDVSADTERCVLEQIQRHLSESFDWVNTRLRSVWRSLHAYTYIEARQAQICLGDFQ